jgi:hypothetical protein
MSPIGRVLALLGGLLIVVASVIPWVDVGATGQASAINISAGWAVGADVDRITNTWPESLFVPVIIGAILVLVGGIIRSSGVTIIGSILVIVVVILWEINENKDRFGGSFRLNSFSDLTLSSAMGPGPVLALIGALLALFCALFLRDRKSDVLPTSV